MRYKLVLLFMVILILCTAFFWFTPFKKNHPTLQVKPTSFSKLPGWQNGQALASLHTFQLSCRQILKQNPEHSVGNHWFALQAKDWQPACTAAKGILTDSEQEAKLFFETWFQPMEFIQQQAITGLFTGYYLPSFPACLNQTIDYPTPIYGMPHNLMQINVHDFDPQLPARQWIGRVKNKRFIPFYSREEIDQGAIQHSAPVLAYVQNPIDRLIIEIQGSGILNLPDGQQMHLGYAGKNGLPYTAIGRVLIERHLLSADQVSIQSIRAYLETHPEEQNEIIHQNRSFVFFQIHNQKGAYGTQGAPLTQGYSLAVDPEWVPLGMPVWLTTTYPDPQSGQQQPLQRLMIAQDTGGAIRGTVRGDVYWGNGNVAAAIAGKMKSQGRYWLLVPKNYATSFK